MRIVDCTQCVTIIPEMAVEYVPKEHRDALRADILKQILIHLV